MTITDYKSFMTGVITGLKLGRTSLGRQPPVPSGKYILTEGGEKVLTETLFPELDSATLYNTNVWYPCPDSEHSFVDVSEMIIYTDVPAQFFYWESTDPIYSRYTPSIVVFSAEDFSESGVTGYHYWVRSGLDHLDVIIGGISGSVSKTGDIFYWNPLGVFKWQPYNSEYFTGTLEQLKVYISGMNYRPLITE